MLLHETKGTICDSNDILEKVVPSPLATNNQKKRKCERKSQHSNILSVVGSCAMIWKKTEDMKTYYKKRIMDCL